MQNVLKIMELVSKCEVGSSLPPPPSKFSEKSRSVNVFTHRNKQYDFSHSNIFQMTFECIERTKFYRFIFRGRSRYIYLVSETGPFECLFYLWKHEFDRQKRRRNPLIPFCDASHQQFGLVQFRENWRPQPKATGTYIKNKRSERERRTR